jgi:glutamate-ammonia-ligase adenylyltransferase
MALCRARPVFGSADARERASEVINAVLCMPRDPSKVIADAVKMRRDMAQHKPPRSALDVKLGPGGLVDLEFAVHVLQLTRASALTPNLDNAVVALAADKAIDKNIVEAQRLLTRMLVAMRLVAPADVKPTQATWQLVAEACGASSWDDLLAAHDEARQSINQLWNRISEGPKHG